jgi:hypothetical protein
MHPNIIVMKITEVLYLDKFVFTTNIIMMCSLYLFVRIADGTGNDNNMHY